MYNTLTRRYLFRGKLRMLSALHIGGGRLGATNTDSPIIRSSDGLPFIPGSGMKGVFRSTAEKLVSALPGMEVCQLYDETVDCPSSKQDFYNRKRRTIPEEKFHELLEEKLCPACHLFGSHFTAAKLFFQDIYLEEWSGVVPVRDGVGIDRDSETAVDKVKYDFEVMEAGSLFSLEIKLEEPDDMDLALTCLGLQEFIAGMTYIGAMRSRGLGNCILEDIEIYSLDLTQENDIDRLNKLSRYLLGKKTEEKMAKIPEPDKFLEDNITLLIEKAKNVVNSEREKRKDNEGGGQNA